MAHRGLVFGALVAATVTAGGVNAQSSGVPANFPPSSFDGNQFVDNEGCAFIRAGIGGNVTWVPRVDRRRNQLCSFQPTFAAAAPAPAAPVAEPTPAPAPVVAAAPEPTPAPAPAAPAPRRTQGAPIQTVASVTTPPLVQIPNAGTATARTPQIVRDAPRLPAAPRVTAAAAPAAPAVAAEPAPRRLTLAQACEEIERTGRPLINGNTGQPVVCPQEEAPTTVAAAPAAAAPEPRRMTRAQICAEMQSTGRRFVNANTGETIQCSTSIPSTGPAAPVAASAPSVPTATPRATYLASNCSSRMLTVEGVEVRCGPQTLALLPGQTRADGSRTVQAVRSTASASTSNGWFDEVPIPASNPAISSRQVVKPPKGYTRVWRDGRHNPNRGLPRAAAASATTTQETVSSRSVQPAAPSHRFVQVGAFADTANAQTVGRQFQSRGLPVGLASATSNGRAVKVVMLGPFSDATALARGLRAARAAGYNSAYTRN